MKMQLSVAVLLSLTALASASYSYGSSVHIPAAQNSEAPIADTYNAVQNEHHLPYMVRTRSPRAKGVASSLALIAGGAAIIGVLFLLVRCVAYISELSRSSKGAERRLAGASSCGGGVSHTRCFGLFGHPMQCHV